MIANANSVEAELIFQLQARNEEAFEELVRQHTGPMLRLAKSFFSNDDDAEDAVQDAFLSAFKSLNRFTGSCALKTWLHRIVVNACLMKMRSSSRRQTVSIEDLLPKFDETGHHVEFVSNWTDNPLGNIINSEARLHVRACIDQLPADYRTVLIMRDIEGLDTAEVADVLKTTHGSIKTRLHRARQALRTLLATYQSPVC